MTNYIDGVVEVIFTGLLRRSIHPQLGEVFCTDKLFFPVALAKKSHGSSLIFNEPVRYWHEAGLICFHAVWADSDWEWMVEEKYIEAIYLADGVRVYPPFLV